MNGRIILQVPKIRRNKIEIKPIEVLLQETEVRKRKRREETNVPQQVEVALETKMRKREEG